MVEYEQKPQYTISDLQEIVRLLRSPGGCPWDREQTHGSVRNDLLEEAYEAAEAIDLQDMALLAPVRDAYARLVDDKAYLKECYTRCGAEALRYSQRILNKVYRKVGFVASEIR